MKALENRYFQAICRARRGRLLTLSLLACLVLLSACATTPPAETPLEARAQARWDALLAGDYASAYSYYSPGYRSSNSPVDFEISLRTRRIAWSSADVQGSECKADACTVDVKVGYRIGAPVPGITKWENFSQLKERWVRTDGQWWFLPEA